MSNFLTSFASFLRGLAGLGLVGLLITGAAVGYKFFGQQSALTLELKEKAAELAEKNQQIERLNKDLLDKQRKIEQLNLALRLMKVEHRLAEIVVLSQDPPAEGKRGTTRFQFTEVDDAGTPLEEPRVFTIEGDKVYIDAWIAKFKDSFIEVGDPLRSTSIYLFRRIFGEFQQPAEGFPLDRVGSRPAAYSRGGGSDLEKEIWEHFWDFANNPDKAEKLGVRAANGEAPSIKLQKGRLYKIQLRASGGLSIVSEDLPADKGPPL